MSGRASFTGSGIALLLALLGASCTTQEEAPALTREELLNPESCKDCHPKHYQEWSMSMHAYASTDPVFVAMNKRGQEEANLGDFCVNCHAPMAVREKKITDFGDLSSVPKELQGVTCYFCHNAVSATEPHSNANVQLANDNVMRGALRNPIEPSAHGVAYSVNHDPSRMESSMMCGTCHDLTLPNGFHLERTLKEYLGSAVADPGFDFQTCQSCHMRQDDTAQPTAPGFEGSQARFNHSHVFAGVDVALTDWPNQPEMRMAVENCELQQRSLSGFEVHPGNSLPGEPFNFTVLLETQAGHQMPSGVLSDRRMWLEVTAWDAAGTEVLRTDQIADGELEIKTPRDPRFCVFREQILDAQGKEVHMFWEAAKSGPESNALPPQTEPGVRHYAECSYSTDGALIDPPARIQVHLRMRPMGVDVLQDLVDSGHLDPKYVTLMPTFTVAHREFVWNPSKRDYDTAMDLAAEDCDAYVQLLECQRDPDSGACND